MGNASFTHSVIWLALAACYDEPEIQLRVTRPDPTWNLSYGVCPVAGARKCSCENSLWNEGEDGPTRDIALYINDGSDEVTVSLQVIHNVDPSSMADHCYDVRITDAMLVRRVELDATEPWSCASGPCETSVPCVQSCGL